MPVSFSETTLTQQLRKGALRFSFRLLKAACAYTSAQSESCSCNEGCINDIDKPVTVEICKLKSIAFIGKFAGADGIAGNKNRIRNGDFAVPINIAVNAEAICIAGDSVNNLIRVQNNRCTAADKPAVSIVPTAEVCGIFCVQNIEAAAFGIRESDAAAAFNPCGDGAFKAFGLNGNALIVAFGGNNALKIGAVNCGKFGAVFLTVELYGDKIRAVVCYNSVNMCLTRPRCAQVMR